MRFVSYLAEGSAYADYGALVEDHIYSLGTPDMPTLRTALAAEGIDGLMTRAAGNLGNQSIALSKVQLLAPVTDPSKILCVGLNYYLHAQEAGMALPKQPSIFVRFPSSLVGHRQPVLRPAVSDQFDFEAELAVVIGRRAHRVDEQSALDYVAGYSCLAENSVRDWQRHSNQATPGKNFICSGAFGPWLVTPDEAGPVQAMSIVGRLNGREMQKDTGDHMIFSVPQIIAYLSSFTELLPGDVISTGTPAGVGFTRKPPCYLKPGDIFEVAISGVGTLSNPVSQAH